MADPILYGPAYSTYVRTARLALEEKGVPHQLVEVDFLQGEMPAEQVARHPFGKVPAFEHNGFALYEACAIARYIDMAFDGPSLQPVDARGAARMTQIVSVLDSYAYGPTISQLVIQRMVQPMLGGQSDEAAISAALPDVDKAMAALEALIGGNAWLAGDALSLADLHAAPIFAYFTATPEAASILADKPGLHRWWEAMQARDSMTKTQPQLG
ncbi:MAG: glutathione S-transferase family protein [Minwuiales bacterium]|nr:glutathione S-transferase family protein [Minwuiales bacterium]